MNPALDFNLKGCSIQQNCLLDYQARIQPELKAMQQALQNKYEDSRASLSLLDDDHMIQNINTIVAEKQQLNPTHLVVVGIGGSNLGTIAVQEAVLGKHYNTTNSTPKIHYADTVDTDHLSTIIHTIKTALQNKENIIINAVSKSGGTTETLANFQILLDVLKAYRHNYQDYIVITTDKDSKFYHLAQQEGYSILEIPKKVGGRFSVFSAVGLFPLGMIGINLHALITGAKTARDQGLKETIINNPSALSAALIYHYTREGAAIHDTFIFSNTLESIGKWYRQLMGESIGKEYDISGNHINCGITPTVSIGSTDLHSMAQLYLAGPHDKFTTFLRVDKDNTTLTVPTNPTYEHLVDNIQGTSLHHIMDAILTGTQEAYRKGKRSFVEITIADKSETSIGQLLQMKMMEMMYLGFLLEVNPFNQPNVEAYKIETKQILQGGKSQHADINAAATDGG